MVVDVFSNLFREGQLSGSGESVKYVKPSLLVSLMQ